MPPKPKNKREKNKYPALKKNLNLKTRQDLLDYDYIDKLDDNSKKWLNAFTEEYINANFKHNGPKLHKSKQLKKDCYDRNNARNRCVLTRTKASGKSVPLDEMYNEDVEVGLEDQLIAKVDKKIK